MIRQATVSWVDLGQSLGSSEPYCLLLSCPPRLSLWVKTGGRKNSEKGKIIAELLVHSEEVTAQKKTASALVCMINSDSGRLEYIVQYNLTPPHPIYQKEAEAHGGDVEEEIRGWGYTELVSCGVLGP